MFNMFKPLDFKIKQVKIPPSLLSLSDSVLEIFTKKDVQLQISVLDNCTIGKPIMVFIHGIGACKETFNETGILQNFSETHRVISIDLPGHGESTMVDKLNNLNAEEKASLAAELYSMPGLIAQIAAVLKKLYVKNADIFGWSIGGHIAHGLAIKYPELVGCLITSGTPAINYAEPDQLKLGFSEWFVDNIIPQWMHHPEYYSREDTANDSGEKKVGAETIIASMGYDDVKGRDAYIVNALMAADPLFRQYLYTTLKQHAGKLELYGRRFLMENTRIPVFLIEGEEDGGCVFSKLQTFFNEHMQGKHPNSQLIGFAKTGHAVFRAHPEKFVERIRDFFATVQLEKLEIRHNNEFTS